MIEPPIYNDRTLSTRICLCTTLGEKIFCISAEQSLHSGVFSQKTSTINRVYEPYSVKNHYVQRFLITMLGIQEGKCIVSVQS